MSNSFATLWTVAHQAPLSMGFSSQGYWHGLPCPSPGGLCLLHWHWRHLGSPCLLKGHSNYWSRSPNLGGGEGKGFLCVWDRLELEGPLHDKNVIMPSHFFSSYVIEANISTSSFHFHQCCSSVPSLQWCHPPGHCLCVGNAFTCANEQKNDIIFPSSQLCSP